MAEQGGMPATSTRALSRPACIVMLASVLLLLWLPLLASLLQGERVVSATEKRFLVEPPRLDASWSSWLQFPARMEAYYDDHIGFRNTLIRSYAFLKIELFGVSPSDKLIVGREGWLFFGDRDAVAHYRGIAPLDEARLERWARVLEERQAWLAERGVAYLLVLVPDKNLVYGEYMPESLPRASTLHPLDQIARHLAAHGEVNVLDLRPALEAAKLQQRVYHRTDSHWNDPGAYVAYCAILERVGELVPALADAQPVTVERSVRIARGLGLSGIVGLGELYREELFEAPPKSPRARVKPEHRRGYDERVRTLLPIALGVDDTSLPRAVMFRDSFGNALIPYLSEHFSRILYVWSRDIDRRVVAIEQPDVVIQEVVGRFLGRRPKDIRELRQAERGR